MIYIPRHIAQDYNRRQRHALKFGFVAQYSPSFAIIAFGSRNSAYERDGMSCLS